MLAESKHTKMSTRSAQWALDVTLLSVLKCPSCMWSGSEDQIMSVLKMEDEVSC